MRLKQLAAACLTCAVILVLTACQINQAGQSNQAPATASAANGQNPQLEVLVVENFLANIVQNVAGSRATIESLIPAGVDPHSFEPTPQDVAKIANAQVLVVNGAGLESWLQETLDNSGTKAVVIEAAAGLTSRTAREGELVDHAEGDPHFWLDPNRVIAYTTNIRDGLVKADPQGADTYSQNAATYTLQLQDLDKWIREQVSAIPEGQRLLVTNHETFGYFADQYGFKVIGTIVPSVTSGAAPSAQQIAQLVDGIKATGAKAIFLETGTNPELADQIAAETGVKVVTGLYTHSLSDANGEAPTYMAMMKFDVNEIVSVLK